MYEFDGDTKKIIFSHNPFSMPQGDLDKLDFTKPLDIAFQYDIVCNGAIIWSNKKSHSRINVQLFSVVGYTKKR